MSYILEALKKSQQERELGRVPRLQAANLDRPESDAKPQAWLVAAVGLGVVAVAIAVYTALSVNRLNQPPVQPQEQGRMAQPAPEPEAPVEPGGAAAAAGAETAAAERGGPLALDDPDDRSVQPKVLVVPAPARPGERLPRGADELRRAVLGGDEARPVRGDERQTPPQPPAPPDRAPVPEDLRAEIEAFKRQVRAQEGGPAAAGADGGPGQRPPEAREQPPRQQAAADADEALAPLTAEQRRRFPPFAMTVHVYDKDPARRFVYINGRKVVEGEESSAGFRLERVLADGAVLSYEGERFLQRR